MDQLSQVTPLPDLALCVPCTWLVLQGSFLQHYTRIAARKFLFFHGKNGGVRLRDLLTSPLMTVG